MISKESRQVVLAALDHLRGDYADNAARYRLQIKADPEYKPERMREGLAYDEARIAEIDQTRREIENMEVSDAER